MQKLLLLVLAVLTLSACNTVKGVGQDVSKGGQAIENAARTCPTKCDAAARPGVRRGGSPRTL